MAEDGTYEAVKKYLESEGPGKSKVDVPEVYGEVEFWWSKDWEVRLAIDQPAMESVTSSGFEPAILGRKLLEVGDK